MSKIKKGDYVLVPRGAMISTTNKKKPPHYINQHKRTVYVLEVVDGEVRWAGQDRCWYGCKTELVTKVPEPD